MGIRFYCPNGHKLNVKSFLAGKRGICPDCGAKVLIPEPPPASKDAEPNVPQMAAGTSDDATVADPQPAATVVPANALPLASTGQAPGAEQEVVISTDEPDNLNVPDPIEQNPEAVWYVRLATGNQYGPAAGDVFQTWLDEGRVTAESLVWREGWAEWQTASTAFPQLIRR